MASVLRGPAIAVERVVGASDPLLVDPSWEEMLDEARIEGHRAGYEEGRQAARGEIVAEAVAASESIRHAVEEAFGGMRRLREDVIASLLHTALDLVERVVGDIPVEPPAVLERIRAALDELDSPGLEVRVAPELVDFVAAALAEDARVTVAADPALGAGESRIVGDWCDADLTWRTAMEILREVVGA